MYICNKDILSDKMSLERKIQWFESAYMYAGISKEIKEFEENTERLNKEDQQKALNILYKLVKYYSNKYGISSKFLEKSFNELKLKLGGHHA